MTMMIISTLNEIDGPVFRRHRMQTANNRAVRPGFDHNCITGYHSLWHGYDLSGTVTEHDTDISVQPLDAPEKIPAGCCRAEIGTTYRFCNQATIWRY